MRRVTRTGAPQRRWSGPAVPPGPRKPWPTYAARRRGQTNSAHRCSQCAPPPLRRRTDCPGLVAAGQYERAAAASARWLPASLLWPVLPPLQLLQPAKARRASSHRRAHDTTTTWRLCCAPVPCLAVAGWAPGAGSVVPALQQAHSNERRVVDRRSPGSACLRSNPQPDQRWTDRSSHASQPATASDRASEQSRHGKATTKKARKKRCNGMQSANEHVKNEQNGRESTSYRAFTRPPPAWAASADRAARAAP